MSELYGSDAYAPGEVARRIETVGVAKARLAMLPLLLLLLLLGCRMARSLGWGPCFCALQCGSIRPTARRCCRPALGWCADNRLVLHNYGSVGSFLA